MGFFVLEVILGKLKLYRGKAIQNVQCPKLRINFWD